MKIKELKDTPFHKKGEEITDVEFFLNYPKLNISDYKILGVKNDNFDFFKVLVEHKFKISDWVFNEKMGVALQISFATDGYEWFPNACAICAVREFPDTYKRLATKNEIANAALVVMAGDRNILIGLNQIWYFNYRWVAVKNAWPVIVEYQSKNKLYEPKVCIADKEFVVKPNGLRVGCKTFTDSDIKFMLDTREQLLKRTLE